MAGKILKLKLWFDFGGNFGFIPSDIVFICLPIYHIHVVFDDQGFQTLRLEVGIDLNDASPLL